MKTIFSFFICLLSLPGTGQDITTSALKWNITQTMDVNSGEAAPAITQLITYQQSHVDCLDAAGNVKYSFTVSEVTGAWSDVGADGSILYEVQYQNNYGTVSFRKSGALTTIRVFIPGSPGNTAFEFTASQVQTVAP